MKISFKISILFIIVLGIAISCKKPVKYSDVPEIHFTKFTIKDTITALDTKLKVGILQFSFVDGDGDIGLRQGDTFPPYDKGGEYYYNLFIHIYKYKNKVWQEVNYPTPYYYRIKYISNADEAQNKTLKGDIYVPIDSLPADTMKCIFRLYDRALHPSNEESTGVVVLPHN